MRAAIRTAIEQVTGSVRELRALITELRPAALDELGTEAALRALAERVAEQHGLDIDLHTDLDRRHDPETESTLYRLVQEALDNVVKHAPGRSVSIEVAERGTGATWSCATTAAGLSRATTAGGFGLIGMRERVALVGGRLEIASAP